MHNRKQRCEELNRIAVPLIIQSIGGLVIGMTDQFLIGRISVYAYSAIGVIISLLYFLAGIFGYTAVTFNIIGAKSYVHKDKSDFKNELASSLVLDVIIGFVFALATFIFGKMVLSKVYSFSGKVLEEGMKYLYITTPYMLFQMIIFTFNSYFKIKKNTKPIMYVSISTSILNVVLDYILIYGKFGINPMGVSGAAIGTIISVALNAIIYIIIARADLVISLELILVYLSKIKVFIKASMPLVIQELLEGSVFVVVINAIISRIGIVELGSYILVKNILDISLMAMFMYGSAVLTLISAKKEENKIHELLIIPRDGFSIAMVIFIFVSLIIAVFRKYVPLIISNDNNVIIFASKIIIPMILMNLFNPYQTIYKYALQACGDSKFVLYIAAGVNALALLLMVLLALFLNMGINGIFVAMFINYITLSVAYFLRYKKVISL